jgi:hypothetical protein
MPAASKPAPPAGRVTLLESASCPITIQKKDRNWQIVTLFNTGLDHLNRRASPVGTTGLQFSEQP